MALYQGNKLLSGVVINKDATSAFQAAQAGGYQGTEQEFNQFLANAEEMIEGKLGSDALNAHINNQNNPHNVTAEQVMVTENVVNAIKETGNWSVDGILTQLGNAMFGGETLYRWTKSKNVFLNTGSSQACWANYVAYPVIYHSASVSVSADGKISLVNPSSYQYQGYRTPTAPTSGDYFYAGSYANLSSVYRTTDSTTYYSYTYDGRGYDGYKPVEVWKVTPVSELVTSTDPNAHYDGEVDEEGWTYNALEPIEAFIPRIQTGSYKGTGTYGASNPNSLTFSFEPKLFIIAGFYENTFNRFSMRNKHMFGFMLTTEFTEGSGIGGYGKKSEDGKTLYWWGTSATDQENMNSYTYYWLAIG